MKKLILFIFLACVAGGTLAQAPRLAIPIGHSGDITAAAISPDEKYILTGSKDQTAILWNRQGQEIQTFKGHTSGIRAVAFLYAGNEKFALTGDGDGHVKQWRLDGTEKQTIYNSPRVRHGADWVSTMTFSPDGKTVCIESHVLNGCTDILTGEDAQPFEKPAGQTPPAGLPADVQLVFSENLILSFAGTSVVLWDKNGKKIRIFTGHSAEVVSVVFPSADGGNSILIGRAGGTALRWDLLNSTVKPAAPDTSFPAAYSPPAPDDPAGGKYFLTSNEGIKMWSRADPKTPVRTFRESSGGTFQSGLFGIELSIALFSPDGKSVLATDKESITQWDIESGQEINSFRGHHERVNAVAVARATKGGMYVLAGSNDNTAKLWDPTNNVVKQEEISARQLGDPIGGEFIGGEIQSYLGHTNDVSSVAFSPATPNDPLGGKYVLTGSRDNTAKLWDRATGKEIATLISLGETDWVISTPSGLFDASPGAMNRMYYVAGVEVIELEQLKERYYEPGLLAKIVGFNQEEIRDVSALGEVALYPEIEAAVNGEQLNINLSVRNGGMGKLSLFINDKEVAEDLNPERKAKLAVDLKPYDKYYLPGSNTLALRVYNSAGWLKSQAYELPYMPPASGRGAGSSSSSGGSLGAAKPHLYVLVIGTSDYSGTQMDLRFPDLDAVAMAQALQAAGSRLFEDRVHLRLLSTADKTAAGISSKKNIAAAFGEFAAQAKPTDVLIVYFSGHGLTYGGAEKSQFYYLTKDIASADLKDEAVRNNYTVSSDDLTSWLTAIAAKKQVMILDACNSGKVVESLAAIGARELNSSQIRALDRMKDRTGMFILTGSAADKVSYEASQYGQGLLTYSLLQGMSGLALLPDKRVDVMTLFQYARDKVPELAKSIKQVQTPVLAFPAGGGSFDIGIVDAGVKIPLVQAKPVFIRNAFQNEETFDDNLGLAPALAEYFQKITARGAQAELIYVDVSEYENAYSIKGRYTVSGDAVEVRARLFQGKTSKGEFQVTGVKTALPALVEAIIEKVSGML